MKITIPSIHHVLAKSPRLQGTVPLKTTYTVALISPAAQNYDKSFSREVICQAIRAGVLLRSEQTDPAAC